MGAAGELARIVTVTRNDIALPDGGNLGTMKNNQVSNELVRRKFRFR